MINQEEKFKWTTVMNYTNSVMLTTAPTPNLKQLTSE